MTPLVRKLSGNDGGSVKPMLTDQGARNGPGGPAGSSPVFPSPSLSRSLCRFSGPPQGPSLAVVPLRPSAPIVVRWGWAISWDSPGLLPGLLRRWNHFFDRAIVLPAQRVIVRQSWVIHRVTPSTIGARRIVRERPETTSPPAPPLARICQGSRVILSTLDCTAGVTVKLAKHDGIRAVDTLRLQFSSRLGFS